MKTIEEMMERLPSSIKETDLLKLSTKKVLAALLDRLIHSEAKDTGIIYCNNRTLRRMAGVGSNVLIDSLYELGDYGLVERRRGTGVGDASEYVIDFSELVKPIKEKSFEDLYGKFLEESKPSETPISTPITTTITTPTTTTTTTSNTISNTSTNTISNTTVKPKTKTTQTTNPSTTELYDECEDVSSSSDWLSCLEEPYEEDSDERAIRELLVSKK